MELLKLSLEQVCSVYNTRMVNDFPDDELKPLDIILKSIQDDYYDCYGLFDEMLVGYVFVIRHDQDYLIDYLAIYPSKRNKGYGSLLIQLLKEKLSNANSILGEVENPEFSNHDEEKKIQTKRLHFYLSNGFVDTNVNVLVFGVQYRLIEVLNVHSKEEVRNIYAMHYKSMLSKEMFENNMLI